MPLINCIVHHALLKFSTCCKKDASTTHLHHGLAHDTRALEVSKLGCTNLIFVEPGAKLNGQYYRDMLLMQKLLPVIRSIAGDVFVFQQDNAPAHRQHIVLVTQSSFGAVRHPSSSVLTCGQSTVLTSVDYRIWGKLQERMYRVPIHATDELRKRLFCNMC